MKSKHYIEYDELIQKNKRLEYFKKNGIVVIPKKNLKRSGWFLIISGIILIPVPGVTIPLIAFGLYVLGLSKYHILESLGRKWRISKLRKRMMR